ncbi:uncharacterized protein KY384_004011 [Bacidia gigantensis]|uniref:uncharacterized protein n=1 Tax=Bacidia gigantensis TaxID=2732470 RepID=UPI001D0524C3|nr:uncharacterized protein KY384_004011 [Bacidia gigantensis]KAG8530656.1 hypothetical protein KY384_004011 [Bacidia gigantensis]
MGAMRVFLDGGAGPDGKAYAWLAILTAVIFTTGHVSDLEDLQGDKESARNTVPVLCGERVASLWEGRTGRTRAYYSNSDGAYVFSAQTIIDKALQDDSTDQRQRRPAVCVIENISPQWTQVIGEAWNIAPDFFLAHANNPSKENLWNNLFNHVPDEMHSPTAENPSSVHITGVFEYPYWHIRKGRRLESSPGHFRRHCWEGPDPYPVASNTRISYSRFLDREIKRISFNDLRQPSMKINSQLHDRREDLVILKDFVLESEKWMPESVPMWHDSAWSNESFPRNSFNEIIKGADTLSQFLMDSFQLLMSTVSTQDSHTSLEQARRGARLTQLAFIYVPLSFVTGIFGMNLKEINSSLLSAWVTVVTLAIVAVCTTAVLWLLDLIRRRKQMVNQHLERYTEEYWFRYGQDSGMNPKVSLKSLATMDNEYSTTVRSLSPKVSSNTTEMTRMQ